MNTTQQSKYFLLSVSFAQRKKYLPDVYYLGILVKMYHVTKHEILNGERN